MAKQIDAYNLPFLEAIEYFRKKKNIPTKKYGEVADEAMDKAFIVSGVIGADMLNDFRNSLIRAIAEGITIEDFRKDFDKIVQKNGWDYKGSRDWRSWVIYDTNLRSSYAAGRERQLADPELRKRRPYGLYVHGDSKVPRPEHLSWDGKVVPLDDTWWDIHTPPNGFGCTCRKLTLSERDLERRGLAVTPGGDMPSPDSGVDKGFAYRPGGDEVGQMYNRAQDKIKNYPDELGNQVADKIKERKK